MSQPTTTKATEAEVLAQVAIIQVLQPFDQAARQRIMQVLGCLIQADSIVPGVCSTFLKGSA